jgi:hypothetical protein
MKTIIQSTIAVAVVCLMAGCETTGLSPREHSGVDYPSYILNLHTDSTNTLPQKPVLPVHLAVAQIGESAPPKAMLDALEARTDLIASVVGIPLPANSENQFRYNYKQAEQPIDYASRVKAVCHLAKAAGADYIFLFGGSVDSWTDGNFLRIFDITIVGGMIFPGSKINMESKGAGTLIEAATEQPVFFVNAENKQSKYSPDYFSEGKTMDMRVQARDELVQQLRDGLLKKLAASDSFAPGKAANKSAP